MDNEFSTTKIKDWLPEMGISVVINTSYQSNENGVAERTNRTVANLLGADLKAANISKQYWCLALENIIHQQNNIIKVISLAYSFVNLNP